MTNKPTLASLNEVAVLNGFDDWADIIEHSIDWHDSGGYRSMIHHALDRDRLMGRTQPEVDPDRAAAIEILLADGADRSPEIIAMIRQGRIAVPHIDLIMAGMKHERFLAEYKRLHGGEG